MISWHPKIIIFKNIISSLYVNNYRPVWSSVEHKVSDSCRMSRLAVYRPACGSAMHNCWVLVSVSCYPANSSLFRGSIRAPFCSWCSYCQCCSYLAPASHSFSSYPNEHPWWKANVNGNANGEGWNGKWGNYLSLRLLHGIDGICSLIIQAHFVHIRSGMTVIYRAIQSSSHWVLWRLGLLEAWHIH